MGVGQLQEATRRYQLAVQHAPLNAQAYINLGYALTELGQAQDALPILLRATELDPRSHDAQYLLGLVLLAQKNFNVAIEHLTRAIALKPDLLVAYRDLGKALHDVGQYEKGKAVLNQAIAIEPQFADLHYFLANIDLHQMNLEAALAGYDRALGIDPNYAAVYSNKAQVQLNLCDFKGAARSARKALEIAPTMTLARSNLLMTLSCDSQCSPHEYLVEARRYGEMVAPAVAAIARPGIEQESSSSQPLRVGFVSGDLHTHPVGFFLESVLANWDHTGMQAIAYTNRALQDDLTLRLKSRFDQWHEISAKDDAEVARLIAEDGINVLVDLSGHTAENRLPLFARRPAPVQVSWLGYWASTGVSSMDWLLADSVSVPEAHRSHFTESICYLPDTRLCFTPLDGADVPAVSELPASRNGYVTFGSFQRLTKLNDDVLALWARVLKAVPHSRLRLQARQFRDKAARDQLMERLTNAGISSDRVGLAEGTSRTQYLAAHSLVDILLDTFPHSGGTTTCEALWMGVPTLTLAGPTMLARQGASMLNCVGLQDWVTDNEDDYILRAEQHAQGLIALATLRAGLREQARVSPLFNGARFASNLQKAFRKLWNERST